MLNNTHSYNGTAITENGWEDYDPTYGLELTKDDKEKIVRLLTDAHNSTACFVSDVTVCTGDLNLAVDSLKLMRQAVMIMWAIMEVKAYFPAEWDKTVNGDVVGYRRAHLGIITVRSILIDLANQDKFVRLLNQLVMELWATVMNFASAAGMDVDKTKATLDSYLKL